MCGSILCVSHVVFSGFLTEALLGRFYMDKLGAPR